MTLRTRHYASATVANWTCAVRRSTIQYESNVMTRWMAILIPLAIRAAGLPALMPLPVKVEAGDGRLPIRAGFRIAADAPLAKAARRLENRIAREEGFGVLAPAEARATLTVECRASGAPALGEDESY